MYPRCISPNGCIEIAKSILSLGERFDVAQAYVDQATAHIAMGNLENAIESYEAALAREHHFPNLQTDFMPFVAINSETDHYLLIASDRTGALKP